jgi:iron complex outermembrane recepter protein
MEGFYRMKSCTCFVVPALLASVMMVSAEEPVALEEITVTTEAQVPSPLQTQRDHVDVPTKINAAQMAAAQPGVSAVTRGADASEPVIRGLGWERVSTRVGNHPVYGACPSRMDPPATYIPASSVEAVEVVLGLPSVTLGPGGTGGKLIVRNDYDRGPDAGSTAQGSAEVVWHEARDGYSAAVSGYGGRSDLDIKATLDRSDLGDYTSGDGRTVPANREDTAVSASLGWRPDDASRLYGSVNFTEEKDVDFPSLPMDVEFSESTVLTLGYETLRDGEAIERVEINAGYSYVDHLMNNKNKANRMMMQAETPSEAETWSARMLADYRIGEQKLLTLGVDAEQLSRDATRTRFMPATAARFTDHIWPDVQSENLGAFAELNLTTTGPWRFRLGARIDQAASDADAADDMIVLGPGNRDTIRNRYVEANGPDAAVTDRDDTMVSANLTAHYVIDEGVTTYLGVGRIVRAPNQTELYFAYAPAPGGYLVGNPALDVEVKNEINAGLTLERATFTASLSAFAAKVDDYIYQTSIQRIDVNGDGTTDNVRGFRNVDAELYGGELAAEWQAGEQWTIPVTLAYVRGKNTSDNRDLPEIPPLSGSVAMRYRVEQARPWWVEAGMQFAARQDKVDTAFPEDETPSYALFHLRGSFKMSKAITLEAGVENLLDEEYHDHLTREALLPSGDLAPGDEVPGPGRGYYIKLAYTF